ncbi:MAG: hypothetical protein KDD11_16875, partial [Acidobacteria bacterium]|nr:hypothetical protein [Acidobacteriota bacterium]
YRRATDILTTHRAVLDELARRLLEHETLDGSQVYQLIQEMTGEDRMPILPALPVMIEPEKPEPRATNGEMRAASSDGKADEADAGGSPEPVADAPPASEQPEEAEAVRTHREGQASTRLARGEERG